MSADELRDMPESGTRSTAWRSLPVGMTRLVEPWRKRARRSEARTVARSKLANSKQARSPRYEWRPSVSAASRLARCDSVAQNTAQRGEHGLEAWHLSELAAPDRRRSCPSFRGNAGASPPHPFAR